MGTRRSEFMLTVDLTVVGMRSERIVLPDWAQTIALYPVAVLGAAGAAVVALRGFPRDGSANGREIITSVNKDGTTSDTYVGDCGSLQMVTTTADAAADFAARFTLVVTDGEALK